MFALLHQSGDLRSARRLDSSSSSYNFYLHLGKFSFLFAKAEEQRQLVEVTAGERLGITGAKFLFIFFALVKPAGTFCL